jgi:hypothetical protein
MTFFASPYGTTLVSTGERVTICSRMVRARRSLSAEGSERLRKGAVIVDERDGEETKGSSEANSLQWAYSPDGWSI